MKQELRRHKDKLLGFEKSLSSVIKCLERYTAASKGLCEAELALNEELQKFYMPEPEEPLFGSYEMAQEWMKISTEEVNKVNLLTDAIRASVPKVQQEYDYAFLSFKKRLLQDGVNNFEKEPNHNSELNSLLEDLDIFNEQKYDSFDHLLALLLKLKGTRRNCKVDVDELIANSGGSNADLSSCWAIMSNYYGAHYMKAFLATEYSVENLEFFVAIKNFKNLTDPIEIQQKASEIYDLYFQMGSKKQLNISEQHLRKLERSLTTSGGPPLSPTSEEMKGLAPAFGSPTKSIISPSLSGSSIDTKIFDDIQISVYKLIEADSYPRFLKSPMFQRLQRRIVKKDFWHSQFTSFEQRDRSIKRRSGSFFGLPNSSPPTMKTPKDDLLTERDWKILLSASQILEFNKGEVIIAKGEFNKFFFKIRSGKVRTVMDEALTPTPERRLSGSSESEMTERKSSNSDQRNKFNISSEKELVQEKRSFSDLSRNVAFMEEIPGGRERSPSAGSSEDIPINRDRRTSDADKISESPRDRRNLETPRRSSDAKLKLADTIQRKLSFNFVERKGLFDTSKTETKEQEGSSWAPQILSTGETFGENAFFGFANQCSHVAAEDQTLLFRVDNLTVNSLLQSDANLCERFFQSMCMKLSFRLFRLPIHGAIHKLNAQKTLTESIKTTSLFESEPKPAEVQFDKDVKIAELLGLKSSDNIVLKEYPCSIEKKIKLSGTLYIFAKHVGFYSKVFGSTTKFLIPFDELGNIEVPGPKKMVIFPQSNKKKYTFSFPTSSLDAYNFMSSIWRANINKKTIRKSSSSLNLDISELSSVDKPPKISSRHNSSPALPISHGKAEDQILITPRRYSENSTILSDKELESIFQDAKQTLYQQNDLVLIQGDQMRKIYRVLQGSCRVELWGNDVKFLLGKLKQGSIFGEITFLFGGGAVVSVVADEPDVQIASIEKSDLQNIFGKKTELAGKFYKFLAFQIANRLVKAATEKSQHTVYN